MENNAVVKAFYESIDGENKRTEREALEFIRSKIIISRYITSGNMEIADICGATGAYSFWLASMGHHVHLLDLAQNHIDVAKQKSKDSNITLASYSCADARILPYDDDSMDLVLLMGAMYHLQERNDRIKCLSEAYRILKPNGTLLCTVVSRYSAMIGCYKYGLINDANAELIERTLETGKYHNPKGLQYAYFHKPEEIFSEMSEAFFQDIKLIAVSGFANSFLFDSFEDDEYKMTQILRHIELTESIPELLGVSKDIIAIGIKG